MAIGAVLATMLFGACGSDSDSSGSGDGELQEATEVVRDFYLARLSGDDAAACSQMSQGLLKKIEGLAKKTSAKGCAAFLEAFTELSGAMRQKMTTVDAVSLDRKGEQASLTYRDAREVAYEMPLVEEDGEWKIAELSAAPAVD